MQNNLLSALLTIKNQMGEDALRNGRVMLSALSDIAPNLKTEKQVLTRLVEINGDISLANSQNNTDEFQKAVCKRLVKLIVDKYAIDANYAAKVCIAYMEAMGGAKFEVSDIVTARNAASPATTTATVKAVKSKTKVQQEPNNTVTISKKSLYLVMTLVAILCIVITVFLMKKWDNNTQSAVYESNNSYSLEEKVSIPTPTPIQAKPTDKTYTATAQGISSDVKVTITVNNGKIVDVVIDCSGETPGLGADIGDVMAAAILNAQSAEIDGIAGVSLTSNAIKTATAECMEKAGIGNANVSVNQAPVGVKTYTATAQGISSDVKVTITVNNGKIIDVKIDCSGETPAVGGTAGEPMAQAIMNAQSADVDGVAGATITSNAIKIAAAECIAQANQ